MGEQNRLELWLRLIESQKTRVKILTGAKSSGLEGHHIAVVRATQEFGMVKKVRIGGYEVGYELTPYGRSVLALLNPSQSKLPDDGSAPGAAAEEKKAKKPT
jgi:hypothetical protein